MFKDIDIDFIKKYDKSGPRYTSYPPATAFHSQFKNGDYIDLIERSNSEDPQSISLYIHIPFCPKRCNFCGCNTIIGKGKPFMERYTDALIKEIEFTKKYIDSSRKVTQIHWGGGTPNALPKPLAKRVMDSIYDSFDIGEGAEIAIECSPAYLTSEDIEFYHSLGFNRMSMGIQDFHDDVLEIINRDKPKEDLSKIMDTLKRCGFSGNNIDLVYGLPKQSGDSFRDNLEKVLALSPDRVVTFSYAHVPWVKEHQKELEVVGLPSPEEKIGMLLDSFNYLTSHGYNPIGMDHFSKRDDKLSIALDSNNLHRNFQGYCTKETTGQVYGFGSSSISQLAGGYAQNHKDVELYIQNIEKNCLAIEKGYKLSDKERMVKEIINAIMCGGYIDFDIYGSNYGYCGDDLISYLNPDMEMLKQYQEDGLIEFHDRKLKVTLKGFLVVRVVAMEFDPNLDTGKNRYSRTV